MSSLISTHKIIADILSFESDTTHLENTFSNNSIDWESVVKIGSKHLVLPAIYCRLEQKELLQHIPDDLRIYLKEITSINRNRNISILNQIKSISELFKENNIDHVFLKGSALLASGFYKDNGERMIGDIDILVDKRQVQQAFSLLKINGYIKSIGFDYQNDNFRHLDRLISEDHLAAVELHKSLLNSKYRKLLDPKDVLKSKEIKNGIYISNALFLEKHIILGWQLNDYGHYYRAINFKYLYDILSIKRHSKVDNAFKLHSKFHKTFYIFGHFYFSELKPNVGSSFENYFKASYSINNRFKLTKYIIWQSKTLYLYIIKRLKLVFSNKSYRKHIFTNKIFPSNK